MQFRHGKKKKRRFRITRATAKFQQTNTLVDLYEGAKAVLEQAKRAPDSVGPLLLANQKRRHLIVRVELLSRGFDPDSLDYDPAAHMEEVNAEAAAL